MDKPISIQDVNGNVTVTIVEENNNKTELSIGSFIVVGCYRQWYSGVSP